MFDCKRQYDFLLGSSSQTSHPLSVVERQPHRFTTEQLRSGGGNNKATGHWAYSLGILLGSAAQACDVRIQTHAFLCSPAFQILPSQLSSHRVLPSTYYMPFAVLDAENLRGIKISLVPGWNGENESHEDTEE